MAVTEFGSIITKIKSQPFFDAQTKFTSQTVSSQTGYGITFSIEKNQQVTHFLLMRKRASFRKSQKYEITNLNTLVSLRDNNLGNIHTGVMWFIDREVSQAEFNQKNVFDRYENWLEYIISTPMKSPIDTAIDEVGMAIIMDVLTFKAQAMADSHTNIELNIEKSNYRNQYSNITIRPSYRDGFDLTLLKKVPLFTISRSFNSDLDVQNEFMVTENTKDGFQICEAKDLLTLLTTSMVTSIEQTKSKSENTKTIDETVLASESIKYIVNHQLDVSPVTFMKKINVFKFIKVIVISELHGKAKGFIHSRRLLFLDIENEMPIASFAFESYQNTDIIRESYTNQTFSLSDINSTVADGRNLKPLDTFVTDIIKAYQKNTDREAVIINTINTIVDNVAVEKSKTNVQISTGQAELFRRALYLKRYDLKINDVEIDGNSLIVECINNAKFKLDFSLSSGSQRPLSVMVLTSSDELIRKSRLNSFDGLFRLMKDVVNEAIEIQNKENAINDALTARGNEIKIGSLRDKHQVITMTIPEVIRFMSKEKLTLDAIVIHTTDEIVEKASLFHETYGDSNHTTPRHNIELDEKYPD